MTTAQEIIQDALDDLIVSEEESSVDNAITQRAIRSLNRMMFALPVQTGFTKITSAGQTLTVDPDVEQFMVTNLAKMLAPKFGKAVSPALQASAKRGYQAVLRNYTTIEPARFPFGFPLGSGNWANSFDDYAGADGDREITEISSDYTLLPADDLVLIDCSSGPVTVTLLSAASYDGYGFTFRKIDDTQNMAILSPAGSEVIRGASDLRFNQLQREENIYSDGANWL